VYESAGDFVIFAILMVMRKKERFQGKLFWFYLLFYSAMRFFAEFFRDDPRGWVIPQTLSTSQAIGIAAAILAIYMLLRKKAPSPSVRR